MNRKSAFFVVALLTPPAFNLAGAEALRAAGEFAIARQGQAGCVVVQGDGASQPEKFAARELTLFLGRVTGAVFPVVAESALRPGVPGIYVGGTRYAARCGIEPAKLGEEEWIIRTTPGDLILSGGRPRGTLYAVYEFLEQQVGCHWLDADTEIIPTRPTLTIPQLKQQAEPWFWRHDVHSPTGCPDRKWAFMVRNKTYRYDFHGRKDFTPEGAFYRLDGWPRVGHSFSYYVSAADWFQSHPEYFSLGPEGKRLPAASEAGPGQLCLTHPDVRRLALASLRKFIARDRAEAAAAGCPPPRVYQIGQNDRYDAHCQCASCQAIARREGGESGPLIDFINDIAEKIEKEHPDVLIETYAYNLTEKPPKTLKPRRNVIVGWCDVYSSSDLVRPLSHPYNADHYQEVVGWSKITPRFGVGDDYWTSLSYYPHFPTPYCIIQSIAPDLKLFAESGARTFFAEAGYYMEAGRNFTPLTFWLAYQLLVAPRRPAAPLVKTFMDGYYGPAAGPMNGYLSYLTGRIDREAEFLVTRNAPHKLKYLDLDFFLTAGKLFDEAQSRVKPGSLEAWHVQRERFIVDGALLLLWPWLDRKLPPQTAMPFDHEAVIRRYDAEWRSYVKHDYSAFYSPESKMYSAGGKLRDKMLALFRDSKLPAELRKLPPRDVADFNWLAFSLYRPRQKFADDADAVHGMAVVPAAPAPIILAEQKPASEPGKAAEARGPGLSFGATGGPTITLRPEEIPPDGRYHLYKIGPINVRRGTMVWVVDRQTLGVDVDRLFVADAPAPHANTWNAYLSLKITSPAGVRGSVQVSVDRVLLAKPQPGEN